MAAGRVIARLRRGEPAALRNLLRFGTIRPDGLRLELETAALAQDIGLVASDLVQSLGEITASLHLRRRGIEAKLIIGTPAPRPDPVLLKALGAAHRWMEELRSGDTLRAIASRAGLDEAVLRKRGQLAFLSPRIQAAVLSGTQPCALTLERMIQDPPPSTGMARSASTDSPAECRSASGRAHPAYGRRTNSLLGSACVSLTP